VAAFEGRRVPEDDGGVAKKRHRVSKFWRFALPSVYHAVSAMGGSGAITTKTGAGEAMGADVRSAKWDGFRIFLAFAFCFQVGLGAWLVAAGVQAYRFLKRLETAGETQSPVPGQWACVSGSPERTVPTDLPLAASQFESRFFAGHGAWPLWFEAEFTHEVKRGKSTRTVLDERLRMSCGIAVKTAGSLVGVDPAAVWFYSPRETVTREIGAYRNIAPDATRLSVTWFSVPWLYVVGRASRGADGRPVITGEAGWPVLVSELSPAKLIEGLWVAAIAAFLAVGYGLWSLLVPWKHSLRRSCEQFPRDFFVLDPVGGGEKTAMLLIAVIPALTLLGAGLLLVEIPHWHERLTILATVYLAWTLVIHISKSIEYFYVADRRDGYLYRIHRNLFSTERKQLVRLDRLAGLSVVPSKRGKQTCYALGCAIPGEGVVELTRGFLLEASAQDAEREFRAFLENRPPEGGRSEQAGLFARE